MNRNIILFTISAALFLLIGGCGPESKEVAPASAIIIEEPKPEKTQMPVEPDDVESKQQDVVTEPNLQAEETVEQKVTIAEPNLQQQPAADTNMQDEPAPKKPVESNSADLQAIEAARAKTAEICGKCNEFLSKYVDGRGIVDYRVLIRKKLELIELLDEFKKLDRNVYNLWPREDKIAFWINVYNLEMTRILLENYPIQSNRMFRLFWPPDSIRHIDGIWTENKFVIMDEAFTLREIDERFFQKEFNEPRVFLAINYGSLSGPPLRNKAYCGENLSQQLDNQVKKFMESGMALKIDRANQKISLSPIFKDTWYGNFFIKKYDTDLKFKEQKPPLRAVLNFLTEYISSQDTDYLVTGNYIVNYIVYNWRLNDSAG